MTNGQRYGPETSLVVVDTQNDFADPEGSLYVEGGDEVVPRINAEVVSCLAAGGFVVYTQDWHPESTPHFQKDGGVWPVHCVMGTWGAELHPRLLVAGPIVRKGSHGEDGYSGFTMRDPETGEETPTRLEEMLRSHRAGDVVIVGLALDYCVKATALDSVGLGHGTRVLAHGTAAVEMEEGDGERAIAEMGVAGVTVA